MTKMDKNQPLQNPKHENFIQAVIDGVPPFKAYLQHCYTGGKNRPSRAQLQSAASRVMGYELVRARGEELKRERAEFLKLSRERIVEEIEKIALSSNQDKVRLEALKTLWQMGGWSEKPKVNVKYELVQKTELRTSPPSGGGYVDSPEGGREKFPQNAREREAENGLEREKFEEGV